jgi:hypothetical protein
MSPGFVLRRPTDELTASHPVFASGKWKPAGDLVVDDRLLDRSGQHIAAGMSRVEHGTLRVLKRPSCFRFVASWMSATGRVTANQDRRGLFLGATSVRRRIYNNLDKII